MLQGLYSILGYEELRRSLKESALQTVGKNGSHVGVQNEGIKIV